MAKQVLLIDGWEVPKLIQYDVDWEPLWSGDTARDLSGDMKGTFIGWFPKLEVKVGTYDQETMRKFLKKVHKPWIDISYYDEELGKMSTQKKYYINAHKSSLKNSNTMKYNAFEFNLIPQSKR